MSSIISIALWHSPTGDDIGVLASEDFHLAEDVYALLLVGCVGTGRDGELVGDVTRSVDVFFISLSVIVSVGVAVAICGVGPVWQSILSC